MQYHLCVIMHKGKGGDGGEKKEETREAKGILYHHFWKTVVDVVFV